MPLDAAGLNLTPLDSLHRRLGGRMVDFAGWALPVQYAGTLAEHQAARTGAALFDVSHMGQVSLPADAPLERLVPADILGLAPFRQRYTLFTNDQGGILDDLMVARYPDRLFLVVNAACAVADIAHLRAHLDGVAVHTDRALLALQGPTAAALLRTINPEALALPFMGVAALPLAGAACWISRSGYTGEDGFEISVPAEHAERLATALLDAGAIPAGLGARDTLRLEAGLPLYGNDITAETTPVEAGLAWSIAKRRRAALDFPGAATIAAHLAEGPPRRRVGLRPDGRAPARAHTPILGPDEAPVGEITSGTFSPTLGAPIAMGYVPRDLAGESTPLGLMIRGQRHPARVAAMPFVPHRYAR